jgi:hypothetical protein
MIACDSPSSPSWPIVLSLKNDRLTYLNDSSVGQKCSMNTKTLFKCKPKTF